MSMIEWVQTDFKQVEWKEMGWRDSNDTTDFPGSLALLWPSKLTASGILKSAKGVAPTYTDTPTLSAGGVVPGDGPAFTDVVAWEDGGTLVVEFTATTASADLVGDVQVFGPLYAYSGGLKAMDGTNVASVATGWDVGDVVTATLEITETTAAELTASEAPGAYYVENVIRNRACVSCPSGIANYTNGAYHLECSGDEGDTALTITGGDSVAHAGSAIWKAVVEYPDGELEFNIVDVVADPTCTLVYPLKKDGPVKVWAAWQSALGQHYSLKGVQCYAETLYRLDRRYAVRDESVFSHYYADVFATDAYAKLSPLIWKPIGGLANNMVNTGAGDLSPYTAAGRFFVGHKKAVAMTTSATGHGLRLSVPITDPFTGRIELSAGANSDAGATGLVVITVDGVEVYSGSFGVYVKTHQVYVENAQNIVITVTRTTTGTTAIVYRIGALHLIRNVGVAGALIDKDAKILLCGDSWMSDAHPTGLGFKQRLAELISADGGTGQIANEAVGGTTSADGLAGLPSFLATHAPDICIINFFTNDNNTGITGAQWGANIAQMVALCKAVGCTPIVMLPDTTASAGQSIAHMSMQDHAGRPVLVKEWLTQATTSELANASFVGNVRNKIAGRKITRVNDSAALVALGSTAASAWAAGVAALRVGDGTDSGAYAAFDGTIPPLSLSPTAPGDLKQVQEWKKVASANEISRY